MNSCEWNWWFLSSERRKKCRERSKIEFYENFKFLLQLLSLISSWIMNHERLVAAHSCHDGKLIISNQSEKIKKHVENSFRSQSEVLWTQLSYVRRTWTPFKRIIKCRWIIHWNLTKFIFQFIQFYRVSFSFSFSFTFGCRPVPQSN